MSDAFVLTEQKQKSTENREIFLDILRIAAACAVVLLHTVTGVWDHTDMSDRPTELTVFLVIRDLVTWCVPIFVLISGYLFLNPERKISMGTMLRKYCRRILLALFLFGVPFACLELIATERAFRADMLWKSVLMVCRGEGWAHMWYLYLILVLYLVTPALKYLLERCPDWLVYVLTIVLFIGGSILPFLKKLFWQEELMTLPDDSIYLFYYLCGYLLAVKKNTLKRNAYIIAGMTALFLPAGMAVSRLAGNYRLQMAYNYPFTVLLSLAVFCFARGANYQKLNNGIAAKKMAKLSSLSFAVYLIHPLFVNIAYKFLYITPLDFPIGLSLPVFFAVILGLSVLTAWLLHKIPLMAKYVL